MPRFNKEWMSNNYGKAGLFLWVLGCFFLVVAMEIDQKSSLGFLSILHGLILLALGIVIPIVGLAEGFDE